MALSSTIAGRCSLSDIEIAKSLGMMTGAPEWVRIDLDLDGGALGSDTTERWHDTFVYVVPSLVHAWQWLPLIKAAGKAHTVYVLVKQSPVEQPLGPRTVSQLGTGIAAAQHNVFGEYRVVRMRAGKWVDIHRSVAAALIDFDGGGQRAILGGLRVGFLEPDFAEWTAGDPSSAYLSQQSLLIDKTDIFPADMLVASSAPKYSSGTRPLDVIIPDKGLDDQTGWSVSIPPVNTRCISPRGFQAYPTQGVLSAAIGPGSRVGFYDIGSQVEMGGLEEAEPLDELLLSKMRQHSYIELSEFLDQTDRRYAARIVSALAVAGVPMLFGPTDGFLSMLGPGLSEAIRSFDSADVPTVRESKSIDMRRSALALFEPASRWSQWEGPSERTHTNEGSISVLLATRRAERVKEAIDQICRQSWTNVQIILVLHGISLSEKVLFALRSDCPLDLVVLHAPADLVLGEVLNLGLSAASGDFIAKMDDDDWYGSHHLRDLVDAKRYAGATLVGSQVEFVYLEDLDIVTRRPYEGERYSDHVAGGTMLIGRSDLLGFGGWRPVHRAVDRCLIQAVDASGGAIYRGHGQNYVMHRYSATTAHGGHTWVPDEEIFLQNSVEQWEGFVPPPQIDRSQIRYIARGRAANKLSVFSDE